MPRLLEIFCIARRFMAANGNPNQWTNGYPSIETIENDINSGESYVVEKGDKIVATFVVKEGKEPAYDKIRDGKWPNNHTYATIHRVASDGEAKGVLHLSLQFAKSNHTDIRIDTHIDNKVMQHLLAKEGFKYCGVVSYGPGAERLAYQWSNG